MLKLEIKLNSIVSSDATLKTVEDIYSSLDNLFDKHSFRIEIYADGTHCYYGNGNPKDYGVFGMIITALKNKQWFLDNTSKWLWYNSDDGDDEEDFSVEDVLYHYTKRKSVA
ncbi:MAG: hypothetical protein K6G24_07830 [Lachnospiraceae bacterium]|nr:hypothetical protein [Lachnospiraceae bacterium]